MRNAVRGIAGIAAFLLLWEVVGRSGLVDPHYVPPVSTVAGTLGQALSTTSFLLDAVSTMLSWLIALAIAIVIAVPAGLVLGSVPVLNRGVGTLIEFIRPIPSVALIPPAVMLLGTEAQTKITLAVFAAVWPILFNAIYAMHGIDPLVLDTANAFHIGRARTLLTVKLPAAAPFVMTGIRLSATIALVVVVSTELLSGGSGGLGQYVLVEGSSVGRMDQVFAGALVAGVLGYLGNVVLNAAQNRWLGWAEQAAH